MSEVSTRAWTRPHDWAEVVIGVVAGTFSLVIGTIFLLVCLGRAIRGDFTPKQHFGFEAAAWYWHFVDVVWLFLFFCIYIWGSWGAPVAAG